MNRPDALQLSSLHAIRHQKSGGEAGIRTLDTLSSMPVFKTGAINRSATSPFSARLRFSMLNPECRWMKQLPVWEASYRAFCLYNALPKRDIQRPRFPFPSFTGAGSRNSIKTLGWKGEMGYFVRHELVRGGKYEWGNQWAVWFSH
jgi:hypothetical protein